MTGASRRAGRLIVLEGIDGAGKSSVQRALLQRWRAARFRVVGAREPNDAILGRQAVASGVKDPGLSALYFTLDRILARPSIERQLREGFSILQDRSYFSTLVYQGARLPPPQRRELASLQRKIARKPDRVVLLDLAAPQGLTRVDRGRRRRSPIERLVLLRGAVVEYRRLARRERWIVVDASAKLSAVVEELDRQLRPLLGRPNDAARRGRTPRRAARRH